MASPPSRSSPVDWLLVNDLPVGGRTIPIRRLRAYLALPLRPGLGTSPKAHECWVDTGAPLTVIPYRLHQHLAWHSLGYPTIWRGISCTLGTIEVWLPNENYTTLRGPRTLVAKFPDSEASGKPLPILLGVEFFWPSQANFTLWPPPGKGAIRLP
jgi:hypothetical protein